MANIAFVFPGQGSQSVGMLAELAKSYAIIEKTFDSVSNALGYDVWQLVQQGPIEKLNQTEHTQVAMLTADVAVFRLLQSIGLVLPAMMAGHSLGEYAALVCANAVSLPDCARLVSKRAELMQQAVPMGQGAMAAVVGLCDEDVEKICASVSKENESVTPANFNAIGQVVIAGHTQAVNEAVVLAEKSGAKMAKIIPVSVPCHCPLLQDAAQKFEAFLQLTPFHAPAAKVISNVDLNFYQSAEQIRTKLQEQLFKPVRWVETIQLMQSHQMQWIIECGPGKVLTGLIKRIDKSLSTLCIQDKSSLEQAVSLPALHLVTDETQN